MIDLLLEAFGLGAVADTYVGGPTVRGISGGQRRRVTLARGVAAKTPLLFCDEPTSGLSATDAELCIKALRIVAKSLNVLVVVVIHQPRVEVAALFDTLVLLTSNPGRMAYFGPMHAVAPYLRTCGFEVPAHANPTDFFLDRATPGAQVDASAHLVEAFRSRQGPLIYAQVERASRVRGMTAEEMIAAAQGLPSCKDAAATGRYAVPFSLQFGQVLRRKLTLTMRNPAAVALPLALPAVQGVVVGAMFQGIGQQAVVRQFSFIFVLLTMLCLAGMTTMPLLIDGRTVMKYETSEALYNEAAAALASLCVDVPLSLAGQALSVLIMYNLAGLPWELLPTVFGWAMLLFSVFDSFFASVAAVAGDAQQAQAVAGPVISIFMLFNGFVITRSAAPAFLRWIFWISPNSYAFQAIAVRLAEHTGPAGEDVIRGSELSAEHSSSGLAFMLAASLMFRALQLVALRA